VGGWGRPGGELALSVGNAPLVAVAHGSRDPRAAATVHALLGAVAARATAAGGAGGLGGDGLGGGIEVRAAFLDHCAPSLPQVLGSLGRDDDGDARARSCIVVPLLLTAAYHSKSDIPAQLAAAAADAAAADGGRGVRVRCAATLGPHPLLLDALERRLREAGVNVDSAAERARTSVVLAAAGSSDPAANATIADLGGHWQRERGWRAVLPGYASATGPSPAEAVAAGAALGGDGDGRVVVATYLLAPGYFADKIRSAALAAGASAVCDVLGAAPEVADVVLARYREARDREAVRERLQPDAGHPERAVMTPRLVTSSMGGNPRGTDLPARAPRRA
jgi:sirohydrochlorin ferrochelatase